MKNEEQIKRLTPAIGHGLPNDQVEERTKLGLVNKTKVVVGKTYLEIILSDVFFCNGDFDFFDFIMFELFWFDGPLNLVIILIFWYAKDGEFKNELIFFFIFLCC